MKVHSAQGSTRRARLLICIDSLGEDAGTERYVKELLHRIDGRRFTVDVCCVGEQLLGLHAVPGASLVLPVSRFYDWKGIQQIRKLRRYLDSHGVDIVHTFMPKGTVVGVLAASHSHTRVVIASRRSFGYFHTRPSLALFRYLNHHTTRILANSEAVKDWVSRTEHVPTTKVDVLYNGVDLERFGPGRGDSSVADALGIPPSARVVGIVANYRPVKDLHLFLRSMRVVADRVPSAAFLLVGQGPLAQELYALADSLRMRDRVFFTNGKGNVMDYLARMSVGCLTSQSEGFSNSILEYMAAGIPVVATDVGGNKEAVEHGTTGFVVPARDSNAFAAPVIRVLEDESLRSWMGAKARERCASTFDIGLAIKQQEEYYLDLLGYTQIPVEHYNVDQLQTPAV